MAAAEVFKVQVEAGEHGLCLFYEGIDEGVVRVVVDAFLTQTEVERIVEEALTVGTGIDDDGQDLGRIDAGSSCIDHEFPRRDADAVGAPVADSQDGFSIGDDDEFDVTAHGGIFQRLFDLFRMFHGKVGCILRGYEELAVFADAFGNARVVDDRHEFSDVLFEDVVKQRPVSAENIHEVMAFFADVGLRLEIAVDLLCLDFDRLLCRRQEADKAEFSSFFHRKCRTLIEEGII